MVRTGFPIDQRIGALVEAPVRVDPCTVNVADWSMVGVPDRTPAAVSVRPAGSVPPITANVYGAVTVESEQGQGSTFRVFLPISNEGAPPPPDTAR